MVVALLQTHDGESKVASVVYGPWVATSGQERLQRLVLFVEKGLIFYGHAHGEM